MQEKIKFLRELNEIIIPYNFTYFHHSTSYIPEKIRKRIKNGEFIRNWTKLPQNWFVIRKNMSFFTRDNRISEVLGCNKPLKSASIIYSLPAYSKPFCIRIIMPKIDSVMENRIVTSNRYKEELQKIYSGYGVDKYPILKGGEKIIIIGSSTRDEVSDKTIDIFYGVRECDIDMYVTGVMETIKSGYIDNSVPNLNFFDECGKNIEFYPMDYSIEKGNDENRYIGSPSEFEQELYEDYKEDLGNNNSTLSRIFDCHKYYKLYDNYRYYKNKARQLVKW